MAGRNLFLIAVALIFAASACSKKNDGSSSSGSTPIPSPTPGVSSAPPFEVLITSQYEASGKPVGPTTTEADCIMPQGTASGTVSACTNAAGLATTSVAIPEGRLYYSTLNFITNIGVGQSTCEIAWFQPFYYQASSGAGFAGPWVGANSIDCSKAPLPIGCFGGVAIDVVPGFPINGLLYFETANGSTFTGTAHSANFHNWASNRFSVNDYVVKAPHVWKNADAFAGNWQDYKFTCFDKYMDVVFAFTLTVTDIDTTPGANQPANQAINFWPDWNTLSWDY